MPNLLKELQAKLDSEIDNLRVAREQKGEISQMLSKAQADRKELQAKLASAEK